MFSVMERTLWLPLKVLIPSAELTTEIDADNNGFVDYAAGNTYSYMAICADWLADSAGFEDD